MTAEDFKVWLEYPVRVTATEAEIKQGLLIDSPELKARDYRFHPKLRLVDEDEIIDGTYEPTELDIHYAKYLKHTVEGKEASTQFRQDHAYIHGIISRNRTLGQFARAKHRLSLTRRAYRQVFIRSAELEINGRPDRYRPFDDDPEGYLIWLNLLLGKIEVDPRTYGDLRLQKFAELIEPVMEFCRIRCETGQRIFSEEYVSYLVREMKRFDRMFAAGVSLHEPMMVINQHCRRSIPTGQQEREGMNMTSTKKFIVRVDANGNFHSIAREEPEVIEATEAETVVPVETDLVGIDELSRRGQVYRLDRDGKYSNKIGTKREPELPAYIDSVDDLITFRDEIVAPVTDRASNNIQVNVNLHQPVPGEFKLRQPPEIDDDTDDDEFEPDEVDDEDFELDDSELVDQLLRQHDKLMIKLDRTNPKKRRKVVEIERTLDEIESGLRHLQAKGADIPYRYRKRTWWQRFTRTVRWTAKNLWEKLLDNLEPILTVAGVLLTIVGVGTGLKGKGGAVTTA